MKIAIIREKKTVPDSRVPLTPKQCAFIKNNYPVEIVVEPSFHRCYTNAEYDAEGIELSTYFDDCDVMMGVKEVPISELFPNKTYFFFSHTIKKQPYNRNLLRAVIAQKIRLIDYEKLENEKGQRLIAFGRFAGMVGAHNGIMTYGWRTGAYDLKRMKYYHDYAEAKEDYKKLNLPAIKIVITGNGRVASGAADVLKDMGIREVTPEEYLKKDFSETVFTMLHPKYYAKAKDGREFELFDFFDHPDEYEGIFKPYTKVSDVMINGIYWDPKSPAFFTKEDMKKEDFKIKVIADVTCDIAPEASIPSTLKAATIAEPIFGYDTDTESIVKPHGENVIDMMTIDNLPNEMPRDASEAFGKQFIDNVLEELLKDNSKVIDGATIATNGNLTPPFEYLRDYVS